MLKKTITYEDYNGEEVSEDFFFHLSKAELIKLEMSHQGGLSQWLQDVVAAEDGKSIMDQFEKIILSSYGVRSADGKRFTKNDQLRETFMSTEAYSTLFVELCTNTDAAIEFVNGVIPSALAEDAAKVVSLAPAPPLEPVVPVELTRADIQAMPPEDFAKLGERVASGEVKLID